MDSKLLFIIPIYYRSFEEHGKEYEKKSQDFRSRMKKLWGDYFEKEYGKNRLKLDLEFQKDWYSWDYTQIIKIVEIRLEQSVLKAYLHSVEAKRFRAIMRRKIFKYVGKVGDVCFIEPYISDKEIKDSILDFIALLRKQFERYYVDSTLVENILPFIDFNRLRESIFDHQ